MKITVKTFILLLLIPLLILTSVDLMIGKESLSVPTTPPTPPSEGVLVELDGNPLFVLKTRLGGLSLEQRVQRVNQRLKEFANHPEITVNEIEVYNADSDGIPLTTISVGSILLTTISNADAQAVGQSRQELAQEHLQRIKEAINRYREQRSWDYLLRGILWSVIATLALTLGLLIGNNLFHQIRQRIKIWGESYIRPVRLGNWEIIRPNQLDNIIIQLLRLGRVVIILGLLILYFPFIFKQFPWTKQLGKIFEAELSGTLQSGWQGFVIYLPSLLSILLVIVITYTLLRLAKPIFQELGEGTISLPGFYPEWAQPTYRILIFLTLTLAAVITFPLFPGFQSPAFQGISVFLGLLISLGSTSVIANLVSGTILIYTRAFRVGDRIRIDEISGKVIETTLLVTRILTPTNVIVSIPNSQISTSSIENFSFSYRELKQPLIWQTQVYLGYEVPWREAYQALREAAFLTVGVAKFPEPFVLQGALNEVYVTYLLNVYMDVEYFKDKSLKEVEQTRSQLHENIRDCCTLARITIFAPSYEADPTNYGPTVRE